MDTNNNLNVRGPVLHPNPLSDPSNAGPPPRLTAPIAQNMGRPGSTTSLARLPSDQAVDQKQLKEALETAVTDDNPTLIKQLIENGARVDSDIITTAIVCFKPNALEALISNRPNNDRLCFSFLAKVPDLGNHPKKIDIIRLLLKHKAPIDFEHTTQRTREDKIIILKTLFEANEEKNLVDGSKYSLLDLAINLKDIKIIESLLANGADINVRDNKRGDTLFTREIIKFISSRYPQQQLEKSEKLTLEIIDILLLTTNPDLDHKNDFGCTLLHELVSRPADSTDPDILKETITTLVALGADISIMNSENQTVESLMQAKFKENDSIDISLSDPKSNLRILNRLMLNLRKNKNPQEVLSQLITMKELRLTKGQRQILAKRIISNACAVIDNKVYANNQSKIASNLKALKTKQPEVYETIHQTVKSLPQDFIADYKLLDLILEIDT